MQRPRYAIASESFGPEIRLRTVPLAAGAMLNEINGKMANENFVKMGGIEMGGRDIRSVLFFVFCLFFFWERWSVNNFNAIHYTFACISKRMQYCIFISSYKLVDLPRGYWIDWQTDRRSCSMQLDQNQYRRDLSCSSLTLSKLYNLLVAFRPLLNFWITQNFRIITTTPSLCPSSSSNNARSSVDRIIAPDAERTQLQWLHCAQIIDAHRAPQNRKNMCAQ